MTDVQEGTRYAEIAQEGCFIRAVVGSNAHGLAREGTDDRDEMGVCLEPPEHVLGLGGFEHWVHRTQPEGVPSGPGDLDLTIYGLRKYCRLALKGSPTVLLLMFVPPGALIVSTDLADRLQAMAPAFLSKRTGMAFLGYLRSQRHGLLGERDATSRERELSAPGGYDTKYAMHTLRVGYQGRELLETCRISLPVPEPARSRLMDVRLGHADLAGVIEEVETLEHDLERLVGAPGLPRVPDAAAVDRFLIDAYRDGWGWV